MKNFLIEFFRPLDNLIFNYFVRIGAVKCIDPGTAISIGSSLLGGLFGRSRAKRAARERAAALRKAYSQFRSPEDIIEQQYGDGLYGDPAMSAILGRERELIPQFQELAEQRARGVRDIQEESKLRQLGLLGEYGADIRGTLEDPRLAQLASMDLSEAERLTQEAAAPLSGERARTAEQDALSLAVRQGRGRGQGAIAQAVLGRTAAKTAFEEQAGRARQRALQSASQAAVDPFKFMFGAPSIEERQFLEAGLGPQVTDPGQAYNIGSAEDLRKAQAILGEGLAKAQGTAASGQILGNMFGSIGSTLGNMNFGQPTSMISGAQIGSYGQNLLNQAGQIQGQLDSFSNISPFGGQIPQKLPFGGYTFP
jgi:hypothetical protein